MKNKLYFVVLVIVCSVLSTITNAQLVRTWTGQGDGQSWVDGFNWTTVTCKYISYEDDGTIRIIYRTEHTPPRDGEIVLFDNVGTLNLTNVPPDIVCGNEEYTDYSEIASGCGGGIGNIRLYALQIIDNSTINVPNTRIIAGGAATPIAGYSESFKLLNSTITCQTLAGNFAYSNSSLPLIMNSIYAENSTITCTWVHSGNFYPTGKTYFKNCNINCDWFAPYSNNDYPNEKDEFIDCTINTNQVYFGHKCTAIATNCTFNLSGDSSPQFSLNSGSTLNSVILNNVQINIDESATGSLFLPYQPGASVINGNINCKSTDPNFYIHIVNSTILNSFPLQLNGNLTMNNGSLLISNQGVLEISGNLEMTGSPDPNYTRDVLINNQTAFQIGGSNNYVNYGGYYGPAAGAFPFGIKFTGTGDSHINWPIGFPADTLIIEKTGCGKVYFDNAPLHVTGKLEVNSGQLVLSPQAGSEYALVNGGNLVVKNGGSILVEPDAAIAIGGSYIDENTTNNPSSCNGFNNSANNTVAFYNTEYTPVNRIMSSANNTSIGNIKFINQNTEPFILAGNIVATNIDMGNTGKVVLGNYDFILNGLVSNYDSTRYFVTNGAGSLQVKNVANSSVFFPVGSSELSYSPVTIINTGTPDDFNVRVQEGLYDNGTSGNLITEKAINSTWFIDEVTIGGSDASITLQWNANQELSNFYRNNIHIIHYINNQWDFGSVLSVSGSNPYSITRNNITSMSPFGIMNDLNASEYDHNDVAILKNIRDSASADSPLKTEWADDSQIGIWSGVIWDSSSPKRVVELHVTLKNLTNADFSGLSNLQTLLCDNNQLTSLDLSGSSKIIQLSTIGNYIPFSKLPLPNSAYIQYAYSPQNKVFEAKEIQLGQEIDYSSEAAIDGTATGFSWYKDGVLITDTNQSGKYIPTESGDFHCEMTNAKFPGLTLTSNTVTLKITSCPQHFQTVWEGTSGVDHMNINIISAKYYGFDLESGDEIGIFDGNLCVGYGKVSKTIDQQNFLTITVSRNAGSGNGYTNGHEVSYLFWDCSSGSEYVVNDIQCFSNQMNPITCLPFEAGATAYVKLSDINEICHTIRCKTGWNIFSVPSSPTEASMEIIFQGMMNNNSLVKIQDEGGNSLENWGIFGGWKNNIGSIDPSEGYKIKANFNDSIEVCGKPVNFPYPIPLNSGWNIMGYPQTSAFDGLKVVQQLIDRGTLEKVQDENGNSIENWGIFGGWQNNIGDFMPGKGFKIKLSAEDTLMIYNSYQRSTTIQTELISTKHFQPEFEGNAVDHMNFYIVGLPVNILRAGDELAIFDGTTFAGAVTLTPQHLRNQKVSVVASATDNLGMAGFAEGNSFVLKLWNSEINQEFNLEPDIVKGTLTFVKNETTVISLEKYITTGLEGITGSNIAEINCYPNPFSDKITLEINLAAHALVQIEVMNQLGERIKLITTKQLQPKGLYYYDWDGKNTGNQYVSPGIYHLRMNIDGKWIHKKVVYSK